MPISFDDLTAEIVATSKSNVLVQLKSRLLERTLTVGLDPTSYDYDSHTVTAAEGTEAYFNQTAMAEYIARIAFVEAYGD